MTNKLNKKQLNDLSKISISLKAYGFWLWEYQRRNKSYQKDYDNLLKLAKTFAKHIMTIAAASDEKPNNSVIYKIWSTLARASDKSITEDNYDKLTREILDSFSQFKTHSNLSLFINGSKQAGDQLQSNEVLNAYRDFIIKHWRIPKGYKCFINSSERINQYINSDDLLTEICDTGKDFVFEIDSQYDAEIAWRRNDELSFSKIGSSDKNKDFFYTELSKDIKIEKVLDNMILRFCSEYLTTNDYMQIYDLSFDQLSNPYLAYQYLTALNQYRIDEQENAGKNTRNRLTPKNSLPRAIGIWVYDYIEKTGGDLAEAHEELLNEYPNCITDTGHFDKGRVKKRWKSTIECIEQVRILPMDYESK